jgi:hypothetical protein
MKSLLEKYGHMNQSPAGAVQGKHASLVNNLKQHLHDNELSDGRGKGKNDGRNGNEIVT